MTLVLIISGLAMAAIVLLGAKVLRDGIEKTRLAEKLKYSEDLGSQAAKQLEELAAARNDYATKAERQQRRADDLFGMIEGVCQERDKIWSMYRQSAHQAGVAQSWLFDELSRAHRMLNAYRAKLGEDPVAPPRELKELLDEFGERTAGIDERPPGPDVEQAKAVNTPASR